MNEQRVSLLEDLYQCCKRFRDTPIVDDDFWEVKNDFVRALNKIESFDRHKAKVEAQFNGIVSPPIFDMERAINLSKGSLVAHTVILALINNLEIDVIGFFEENHFTGSDISIFFKNVCHCKTENCMLLMKAVNQNIVSHDVLKKAIDLPDESIIDFDAIKRQLGEKENESTA